MKMSLSFALRTPHSFMTVASARKLTCPVRSLSFQLVGSKSVQDEPILTYGSGGAPKWRGGNLIPSRGINSLLDIKLARSSSAFVLAKEKTKKKKIQT